MAVAGRPKCCARSPSSAAFGASRRSPRVRRDGGIARPRAVGRPARRVRRAAGRPAPGDGPTADRRADAGRGGRADGPLHRRGPRAPAPRPPAPADGTHPARLGAQGGGGMMLRLLICGCVALVYALIVGAIDLRAAQAPGRPPRGPLDDDGAPRGDRWDGSGPPQRPRQKILIPRVSSFVTFAL